ncbi:restriction endonuclease subunit S [Asticcacaulis sp.]|uniref:restriction endonuclease subunit S n=1 Tax=Asticcacaulis sp. TaxID=1872648 RepID=UPI003F7C8329
MSVLGEVAEVIMGQAPDGESYNFANDGLPLIAGAGDFGEFAPEAKKYTTSPTKISEPGDIILSIRATIGTKVVGDKTYCLGRGVAGVRAKKHLDHRYLWHWLSHIEPVLAAKGKGATFPQVSRSDITSLQISLPPLDEQKRIAAILDQADSLRRLRQRSLDRLNTLSQAIFYEMFGDPTLQSNTLQAVRLSDVCKISSGSTPSRGEEGYYGGTTPWVKTGEVKGEIIYDTEEHVTELGIKASRLKIYPKNSILLAMYGQGKTRGNVALLGCPATTNQACAVLQAKSAVIPRFLFEQLKILYEVIRQGGRGGNQPNLNGDLVGKVEIILPEIKSQMAYVERIETLSEEMEKTSKSMSNLYTLFASLQHRAFRGEL